MDGICWRAQMVRCFLQTQGNIEEDI
jgi:hypothetical protein